MQAKTVPFSGDEFEIRCEAPDAEVTLRAMPLKVPFTGSCSVRVGAHSAEADSITLELLSMRLKADLPDAGGAEDGGTIDVRLNDGGAESRGQLRLPSDSSQEFTMLLVADIVATVDQPGGKVDLVADGPMQLAARLPQFPPRGDGSQLRAPVSLVVPDSPDATVVQIQKLSLQLDTSRK